MEETKTTTFLLRDVDAEIWSAFRQRAAAEGKSAKAVLLELIAAYIGISETTAAKAARRVRGAKKK